MTDTLELGGATLSKALRWGRQRLSRTRTETPGLDAEVLLRHALGTDRTRFFASLSEAIEPAALAEYCAMIADRERGQPVAYITCEREFMGLPFALEPGVLVPRPETEILVGWATNWLRDRERATIIDVGTGTGAIALSLAKGTGPRWSGRILATDISPIAIACAARNRERFDLFHRVSIVRGSLVSWLRGPADLLLANLPYLRPDQIAENPDLAFEPRSALDGGDDGLVLIHRLLRDAPRVLAPGGALGLEIDPSQRSAVMTLAERAFPEAEIAVLRDLAGLDRHIVVQTCDEQ